MEKETIEALLEKQFSSINKIILSRQDAITGLLPASTAITAHGDYTDAWVRDNVYSIMSVWGLSLAYKEHAPQNCRGYLLGQSVVKLMRGLLMAMMHQADRVETYKQTHKPTDALHAKYGTATGLAVVGDDEWGHLQLDASSLFVLMIAQMSASGLSLIYTLDEVDFVQNLVHYISRTYATPDYGIWERGNKINHGTTEINCSSVGMAKAALEAIDDFNLFGEDGAENAVIHVAFNDIARSRLTLQGLLPRESNSKETDGALLSIIGYPAYAVEDAALVEKTRKKIVDKLAGRYGCKRFLLDGHQSSIENASRLHYEPSELKEFENIESEWSLFFTYLLLDALMREDKEAVVLWREKLEPLFVEVEGERLLPELFIVEKERIEAEKEHPHTQERVANENIPLVWAQSLYMLSDMIMEGILSVDAIDPLNRRKRIGKKCISKPMVAILAQNSGTKEKLAQHGIFSQTIDELDSLHIAHASELSKIHEQLGKNKKLGLSGRNFYVARTISTAHLYLVEGEQYLFLPYYFDTKGFYLDFDNRLLVEHFKSSLEFLSKNWDLERDPIMPFFVREDMLLNESQVVVINLLQTLKKQKSASLKITTGKLEELIDIADVVKIDNLSGYEVQKELLNEDRERVGVLDHDWAKARRHAQELEIYDDRLEDALMDIIISQKHLAVGRAYSDKAIFSNTQDSYTILQTINKYCGNNTSERVLTQEIILHLGNLIRVAPKLFENVITLRTWDYIQLLVGRISREKDISIGDAYEALLQYSPHYIYDTLRGILKSYSQELTQLRVLENIQLSGVVHLHEIAIEKEKKVSSWALYREEVAMVGTLSSDFYFNIWHLLQQCRGLVIGDKYSVQSRIGSELTLESTARERSFELKIDTLLQGIEIPEYRHLNIELLETLSKLVQENPQLCIENDLILDVLIGYAVRIAWNKTHDAQNYDEQKGKAWDAFYKLSLREVEENFIEAFIFLTRE